MFSFRNQLFQLDSACNDDYLGMSNDVSLKVLCQEILKLYYLLSSQLLIKSKRIFPIFANSQ